MLMPRVMPCLLLNNRQLVKTVGFKNPTYIGDPVNAVKIYNDKEVDELIFLDISASQENRQPRFSLIAQIAEECFMPFTYGGGVRSIEDIQAIISIGVEKVALSTYAIENPEFIRQASSMFGSQSILVVLDIKKNFWGKYLVYSHGGRKTTGYDPVEFAILMQEMGAGELVVYSIDRDGTGKGYDIELLKRISDAVEIPVIACGGAGKLEDFRTAVQQGGASAIAAGSMFVFQGRAKGVLINFPSRSQLENIFR